VLFSRIGSAILLAGGLALHASVAQATTVSGSYHGHVNYVDPQLAGAFALGDPFTLNFTYDPNAVTDSAADPNLGLYGPVFTTLAGSIGSYNFALSGSNSIDVQIGSLADALTILADVSGAPVAGYEPAYISAALYDYSKTALSNDSLPSTFLPASLFSTRSLGFTVYDRSGTTIKAYALNATIDTPLPPPLLLFVSAIGGLGAVGWRRSRRSMRMRH